jgi:hypothetical protein
MRIEIEWRPPWVGRRGDDRASLVTWRGAQLGYLRLDVGASIRQRFFAAARKKSAPVLSRPNSFSARFPALEGAERESDPAASLG